MHTNHPEHPVQRFREKLAALREASVLPTETSFATEIKVPGDLVMAFSTDRPELLALAKPRALDADQVKLLYDLIAVMMKANRALREHIHGTGELIGLIDELVTNHSMRDLTAMPAMIAQALNFCRFDDEIAQEVANERSGR